MKTKSNGLNIVDMKTQKNDKHLGKRLYTLKEEADKIAGRVIKYYNGSGVTIKNSNGLKHHLAKKALHGELEIPDGFAVAESLKKEAICSSCGKPFPQENMMRKNNSLICVKCCYQD